jgi:diadenosine tetraphosphatase ApaH/serine/threonine PP2A family protein phosphatase
LRILVISDIHGNLAALDAVIAAAEEEGGYGRVWVLGDTIGYGPRPNECLERIRSMDALVLAGNHEKAITGEIPDTQFNPLAAEALRWTAGRLTLETAGYVREMPVRAEEQDVTLVHGTPRDPLWEYLTTAEQAMDNFARFTGQGCAHGHTHIPLWLTLEGRRLRGGRVSDGFTAPVGPGRFFMNPGSVGQPRDGDPRASYALLDLDASTVTYRRVAYDIRATQAFMEEAGLPLPLIKRLAFGR